MEAIGEHLPALHEQLMTLDGHLDSPDEEAIPGRVYDAMPSISIDCGVMEKASNVLALPGDFGWSDLGSWDALADVYPRDEDGMGRRGRFITVDSADSLVMAKDKLIALVGVEDVVVVARLWRHDRRHARHRGQRRGTDPGILRGVHETEAGVTGKSALPPDERPP